MSGWVFHAGGVFFYHLMHIILFYFTLSLKYGLKWINLIELFAYTAVYTVYTACKRYSMGSRVGRLAM